MNHLSGPLTITVNYDVENAIAAMIEESNQKIQAQELEIGSLPLLRSGLQIFDVREFWEDEDVRFRSIYDMIDEARVHPVDILTALTYARAFPDRQFEDVLGIIFPCDNKLCSLMLGGSSSERRLYLFEGKPETIWAKNTRLLVSR